eukprot:2169635-Alexandrium_andersonii.AAC.1
MSASLVGSEMCIRDSLCTHRHHPDPMQTRSCREPMPAADGPSPLVTRHRGPRRRRAPTLLLRAPPPRPLSTRAR